MTLLVDTSVLYKPRRLRELCGAANSRGGRVVVPALVHAERLFQLHRKHGASFDPGEIRGFFEGLAPVLTVEALDGPAAEELALHMGGSWRTDGDWRAAKREAYRRCMGDPAAEPGTTRPCGAPLDLYLVGLARPSRPIVTVDRGPEWSCAPAGCVLSLDEALRWLETA